MREPQIAFDAIGTRWGIDIYDELPREVVDSALARVHERIASFDKNYSRFRADSLVSAMSRAAGVYALPDDAAPMLSLYKRLYDLTDGAFTPLIGQVLVDAGYDAQYSLRPGTPVAPPAWDEVLVVTPEAITIKKPTLLDFGAAGKGYLIDIVGTVLAENGIRSFCIDAGGDILHRRTDEAPLRVGLENPDDTTQVIGVVEIGNESICGSSGNRRKWEGYNHIIDPHSLGSTATVLATWVRAETALLADALATCLFFVPAERLAREFKFEYLSLNEDRSVEQSAGFIAELFTS